MTEPRLPYHDRALELFREGYDIGSARLIAADEHRLASVDRELVPITVKFPASDCKPPRGRLVGFERGRTAERQIDP